MIKLEKEELLKLADLSGLKLDQNELAILLDQIKLVLNYTQELSEVKLSKESSPIKNVNIFREDKAIQFDSKQMLEQAPEKQGQYFVVPEVLKK